jgi:hypothetical protein
MMPQCRFTTVRQALFVSLIGVALLTTSRLIAQPRTITAPPPAVPKATSKPSAALPPGWEEIDQRLIFLTVQLSTIESSIDATDKTLKQNGYQKIAKEQAADAARQKNEAMDRRGGGPVPWQDFYGKTAEKFFYHPADRNSVFVNPRPIGQRPPQFDYIYRANEDNRQKAEDDAAKIGNKIEDLLSYRKQLEAEQLALWCKIALRCGSSLELSAKPIYRLDLTTAATDDAGKQSLDAARAAVCFMRAIDTEIAIAQKSVDDPKAMLEHLLATTTSARAEMQMKLLQLPMVAAALANPREPFGQFSRLTKRLEDSAQNLGDAYRLAADSDEKDDLSGKRSYRGQFQQTVFDYASTMLAADQSLTAAATAWKVTPTATATVKLADPTAVKPADMADTIPARMEGAKEAHAKEIAAARRVLVSAIDARLNAAADAGNLSGVQALQAAKIQAARDGSIAEAVTDESVHTAKKLMDQSIATAHARLVTAYREAISSYTKARKITEALAVQEELNNSGLPLTAESSADTGTMPSATGTKLLVSGPGPMGNDGAFPPPTLPDGKLEVELAAAADEVCVGGGGRYLILHLKKLRQLAIFDVSQAKVVKYLAMPSSDIVFTAGSKKLYVGVKDLKRIQRWDLARLELELTVPAPEGGIVGMAIGASSLGPIVMCGEKRFWLVNSTTLKAEHFPSKNWGSDGSAWGPVSVHVSFDGSTAVASGGGWAGVELATLSANKVTNIQTGGYVHGDATVSGNGSLVFMDEGGIVRSDMTSKVTGIEGHSFPADDNAFSLAFVKDKNRKSKKTSLIIFSNGDPRPLITLRDLPELAQESKMPLWQRIHLIPSAKVLVTLGEGAAHLVLRKFDLARELEAEGIDYLFVESSPVAHAQPNGKYTYKMVIRSKKGGVKAELQTGPKGMTVSKDGIVQWTVPTRPAEPHAIVIIQVSDASGQSVFHSFGIEVAEATTRK